MSDYANVPGDGGLGRGGDLKQRFYDVAMIAKREERARIREVQAVLRFWMEHAERMEAARDA